MILDLHSRKRIGQPEFGNLAMPDSESIAFWTSVATAYHDNPSVMFDAFNEPYSRYNASSTRYLFDLTWACWRDGGCRAPIEDDQSATTARVTYVVQGMAAMVERDPQRRRRPADPARRPRLRQRPGALAGVRSRRRPARGGVPLLRLQGVRHQGVLERRDRPSWPTASRC